MNESSRSPKHSRRFHNRPRGFTLVELMVVVAIMAILVTLAAPSFVRIVQRYQVRHAMGDFTAALYLARSEAIKRGGHITLAKATAPGCTAATNEEWRCGWEVFVDANENGTKNDGDEVLLASGVPRGVYVYNKKGCSSGGTSYRFNAWGDANGMGTNHIYIQPADDSADASDLSMTMYMSSGGRIRTAEGEASCT